MNVFLFEHICGGGILNEAIPDDWAAQGSAMLRAVARDLLDAGVAVVTTRDARIHFPLPQATVVTIDDGKALDWQFDQLSTQSDAVLVIAPETDGVLEGWSNRIEQLNVPSLGSATDAIKLCSDKIATAQCLRDADVPTPKTLPLDEIFDIAGPCFDECRCMVVKPRDGAGCEHTLLCQSPSAVRGIDPPSSQKLIVQPFVSGIAVSVSFIVHRSSIRPLPAGQQVIRRHADRLTYQGGRLPLADPLESRARKLATRAMENVPDLRGFVGVDLILADDEKDDCVIEINPRVTMSYVGLSLKCQTNLARALIHPGAPLAWSPGTVQFDASGHVR